MVINKDICNISYMFKDCESLLKLFFHNENEEEIIINKNKDIKDRGRNILNNGIISDDSDIPLYMNINKYSKQDYSEISEKEKENTINKSTLLNIFNNLIIHKNNFTNLRQIFSGCRALLSLPDISIWNTNKTIDMSGLFNECISLKYLPDISKWNTDNVIDMSDIFCEGNSLISLPDISKWNTKNVIEMSQIFSNCSSLLYLPDISKWNTDKVINMSGIFAGCLFFNYSFA